MQILYIWKSLQFRHCANYPHSKLFYNPVRHEGLL